MRMNTMHTSDQGGRGCPKNPALAVGTTTPAASCRASGDWMAAPASQRRRAVRPQEMVGEGAGKRKWAKMPGRVRSQLEDRCARGRGRRAARTALFALKMIPEKPAIIRAIIRM